MQLARDDVVHIVREVWSSMLGLEAHSCEETAPYGGPAMAGSVGISGATDCLIALQVQTDGARQFAAAMFGLEVTEISDDDVADAVGELTNMVGGNIKSLLPEPSSLSLPVVAQGSNPLLRVVGGTVIFEAAFVSNNYPICVTVWSRPQRD
ncbi:MAG TPA: chemotaxis protein CheX [Dermatophilaceae bacterium]|nr:chemotaxis protein CheX [Dermatophilaceae bacterium]